MNVKDIMRTPVVTIHQSATLREAMSVLCKHGVSGLPVLDDKGELVGIVTEHDLIQAMLPTYEDILGTDASLLDPDLMYDRAYRVRDNPVSSIMVRNVVTVDERTSITKAASTVIMKRVKRLPVIRDRKPVGIVSRIDIAEAILSSGVEGMKCGEST